MSLSDADAYDRFMGRYSRPLAVPFADFAGLPLELIRKGPVAGPFRSKPGARVHGAVTGGNVLARTRPGGITGNGGEARSGDVGRMWRRSAS